MNLFDYQIIAIKDYEADSFFSWSGCDNDDCDAHGVGATVHECVGKVTHKDHDADEFNLCEFCIYGERPE